VQFVRASFCELQRIYLASVSRIKMRNAAAEGKTPGTGEVSHQYGIGRRCVCDSAHVGTVPL